MVRVYKRKGSRLWTLDVWPAGTRRMRITAFSDRAASEQLGRQIERLADHVASGDSLPAELVRWLERLPARLRKPLAERGLIGEERMTALRPMVEHVEEWEGWLRARASEKHAVLSATRVRRVLEELGWHYWTDLDPVRAQTFLRELVQAGWPSLAGLPERRPLAARTSNAHLAALRQLCRWMVTQGRAAADPLASVARINEERAGKAKVRRALSEAEIAALLEATAAGPTRAGIPGPDRAAIYRMALETGLRANELRHLEVRDLELEGEHPHLVVRASYAKSGREDRLPLRADFAALLRPALAGKHPRARVFSAFPPSSGQARILHADLIRAGIEPLNEQGESVDFHALRHSAVSRWARAGVSPKTLQRLARHSTARLTMDVYTHTSVAEEARAIESVPPVPTTTQDPPQRERATGTSCASPSASRLAEGGGKTAGAALGPISPDPPLDHRSRTDVGGQSARSEELGPQPAGGGTRNRTGGDGFAIRDQIAATDSPAPPYEEALEALCLSLCLSPGEKTQLGRLLDRFAEQVRNTEPCERCAGAGVFRGSELGLQGELSQGEFGCPWCAGTGRRGGAR